jgi:hypothetical protein
MKVIVLLDLFYLMGMLNLKSKNCMKTLFLLLFTTICFSQVKPIKKHYKYGCEGIELLGTIGDSSFVYSNHLAKCEIKIEVGDSIIRMYMRKKINSKKVTLFLKKAKVVGYLKVIRKENLIHLLFSYQEVYWKNNIVELPIKK